MRDLDFEDPQVARQRRVQVGGVAARVNGVREVADPMALGRLA
jgi:hypothetical protein